MRTSDHPLFSTPGHQHLARDSVGNIPSWKRRQSEYLQDLERYGIPSMELLEKQKKEKQGEFTIKINSKLNENNTMYNLFVNPGSCRMSGFSSELADGSGWNANNQQYTKFE